MILKRHWRMSLVASFAEAWIEIVPSAFFVWLFGSPPSRRRGLKFHWLNSQQNSFYVASFAEAWIEIQIKYTTLFVQPRSPPSRRRGLKSDFWRVSFAVVPVASFAEAWIEIFLRKYWYAGGKSVASFAEAWIEIPSNIAYFRPCLWSPPSRRRGLKSFLECRPRARISVASFAEAWIEIWRQNSNLDENRSPPSRRRGLKFLCIFNRSNIKMSPPSRRRGLKFLSQDRGGYVSRRLLRGGVDWNEQGARRMVDTTSPPSRRRGLKSFVFCLRDHFFQCRLLGNRQGFMF